MDFGKKTGKKDIVIVCAHDADTDAFLGNHPNVIDALDENDQPHFKNYLDLERDAGSFDLSRTIAEILSNIYEDVGICLVKANIPRGIKDANRMEYASEPRVFKRKIDPNLKLALDHGHIHAILETFRAISHSRMKDTGIIIDVHTMASHSPNVKDPRVKNAIPTRPGNLRDYINAWVNPELLDKKRVIDVIAGTEGELRPADDKLAGIIEDSLRMAGYESSRNYPYRAGRGTMTQEWLRERPGFAIDVPKDLLVDGGVRSKNWNPVRPVISQNAVTKLAKPIAEAIAAVLQARRIKDGN